MRLQLKFVLFNTFSKVLIVVAFWLLLPTFIDNIASIHMDKKLVGKMEKMKKLIQKGGINQIKDEEDCSYGDYNLLKDEYITVEPYPSQLDTFNIKDGHHSFEGEKLPYRVLNTTLVYEGQIYMMEIGEGLTSMHLLIKILKKYTFEWMSLFIFLTLLLDLTFSRFLLAPLNRIINKKLKETRHPSNFDFSLSKSSTKDFKYLEESINEMMHKIQNAFNIEKEFITNVSHELLTPISILQSKIETLVSDPNTSEEVSLKLLDSQKTLIRLNKIIKTLLLISKIENEQYIKEEKVDLKVLINEVIEEIEERLTEKNITITQNWEDDFVFSKGNKSLLFTMFFNLISNAIKYNKPDGKIIINGYSQKKNFVVEITDTGVGIEKSNIPHVFERFKRFDNRGIEGYGLGLPIVKTISLFHDINIEVNSDVNRGSTFRLFFKE